MKKRLLIFYTFSYPNENGEVFIENEIRIIKNYFEKIVIICSADKKINVHRYTPENSDVYKHNYHLSYLKKLLGVRFILSKIFWAEILHIKKSYHLKLSRSILKTLLNDLSRGYSLYTFTKRIIESEYDSFEVYFYSYWFDYKAFSCALLKKHYPSFTALSRAHRWDLYFYANEPPYLPLRKYIFKSLDAIYCISQDGFDYLTSKFNFHNSNIFISRLGTYNIAAQARKYDGTDTLHVVSCSYLVPEKRLDLLIYALSLITEIPIKWIHFGDGILRTELLRLSETLLRSSTIEYEFKGQTDNEAVLEYYNNNQVDIFINVSSSEGIPVSIMEALSFGIPVIATSAGGNPEIVKNMINGILLPVDITPEIIAGTIRDFYLLPLNEKLKLRFNAFTTWKEEYDAIKNYTIFSENIIRL